MSDILQKLRDRLHQNEHSKKVLISQLKHLEDESDEIQKKIDAVGTGKKNWKTLKHKSKSYMRSHQARWHTAVDEMKKRQTKENQTSKLPPGMPRVSRAYAHQSPQYDDKGWVTDPGSAVHSGHWDAPPVMSFPSHTHKKKDAHKHNKKLGWYKNKEGKWIYEGELEPSWQDILPQQSHQPSHQPSHKLSTQANDFDANENFYHNPGKYDPEIDDEGRTYWIHRETGEGHYDSDDDDLGMVTDSDSDSD